MAIIKNEYEIIVCKDELEEHVFHAMLSNYDVNIINDSLAGNFNREYPIETLENEVIDVGIIDEIQLIGETKGVTYA